MIFDRTRGVEVEKKGGDHGAEDAHGDEPVLRRIVRRQREGERAPRHFVHRRMMHHRGDDKCQRDQPENRCAVLDGVEGRTPQKEPDQDRYRKRKKLQRQSGHEMHGKADSANLRRQNQQMNDRQNDERHQPEREPEMLANGVRKSFPAHGGEASGHLHQEDDDDRGQDHREHTECIAHIDSPWIRGAGIVDKLIDKSFTPSPDSKPSARQL